MTGTTEQKAVIYCRVSDPKQKTEGHGLDSQETRCREYADRQQYEVVEVFRDDFTGATSARPEMKRMLAFLKRHKITYYVIIDDLSRLARDVEAHMQLRRAVKAAGAIMVSPSHQFREDSDGRFVENVLASSYQHQREKNAEQTMNRMRSRCMDGYWVFQPPKGYRFQEIKDERSDSKAKMLVRDEPLASIVQEALEGYASGRFETQAEVARFLERYPEVPRDYKNAVRIQRVYEMLTQVLYAGYIDFPRWNVSLRPAQHEGLISYETFQKIQRRLTGNAKAPARKNLGSDFALRGFVACTCGTRLTSYWAKGRNAHYAYYHCPNKECSAYGRSIPRAKIEGEFETVLRGLRPSHNLFVAAHEIFSVLWQRRLTGSKQLRQSLEGEVRQIERDVGQFLDRILEAEGQTVRRAYEARIHALEERKAELKERIANCGKPLKDFDSTFRTAMTFLGNPCKIWESGSFAHKRLVLRLAFDQRLEYCRENGFRTALTSSPFTLLGALEGGSEGMVPGEGVGHNHTFLKASV